MAKLDLKKELKPLYMASPKAPALIEAPRLDFLMIDGHGLPDRSPEFHTAVARLYSTAYTLKFQSKKAGGPDWAVMPLEGLWWRDQPDADWRWTLMIAQPPVVNAVQFHKAVAALAKKKPSEAGIAVRLDSLKEGLCVQYLHIGPYQDEEASIAKMSEFADASGYLLTGKHHEIYLSDPQRTPPERLKTILRHPVKRAARAAKA